MSLGSPRGDGPDTLAVPPALPELGKVRCYWALMDSAMNYRYLDPVLAYHLKDQASLMIGHNLVDFIHPDEKEAATDDFAKFRNSTTIFGSVTRCRYARVPHCRRILGASDAEIASEVDEYSLDEYWLSSRITASLVAENTVLTFYHATHDLNPVEDADDVHHSSWTNWCGPRVQDVEHEYLTPYQKDALRQAFVFCQNESNEAYSEGKQQEIGGRPAPPSYVFQILGSNDDQIHFTWPPTHPTGEKPDATVHGEPTDGQERYAASEYASLARSVVARPREKHPDEAKTSCTKRFQSKHPFQKDGISSTVESVVIVYQALTFVCFQTGKPHPPIPQIRYEQIQQTLGKRKGDITDEDANAEILKRLRSENAMLGTFNPSSQESTGDGEPNFPAMPSPAHGHGQLNQSWASPEDPNNTYYPNASYPSVYSQMFQNLGNNPTDEAAGQNGSNGLHDLAMASASTYYSDYDAEGQPQVGPDGEPLPDLQFIPRQRGEASNQVQADTEVVQPTHRVRKADRNRICTSCGTTNSPEWRKGPSGIKTLCNACGLRYSRAQTRKKKKEQKENAALEAAAGVSTNIGSTSSTPTTPYLPAPLQLPPGMGSNAIDDGQGEHSPYMNISVDYGQHSAQLPPLPQSAGIDGSQQGHQGEVLDHSQGAHQGNGSYGGYGAWSGYNAYNDWSPNTQQNFAQHQDQHGHHEHEEHH